MFDPNSIAFEIKSPFKKKSSFGSYRESLIEFWHKDPCAAGDDDSCWTATLYRQGFYKDGHIPYSYDSVKWWNKYIHYKLHFWHIRPKVPFFLTLKRFLWSKCCICGKGFTWGYCPVTNSWSGKGPRWFRGETDVFHDSCDNSRKKY